MERGRVLAAGRGGHLHTRRKLPASAAFAFHGGCLSALVETPTFCVEDAGMITDELCRFLPQPHADQLLIIWPGAYTLDEDDGGTLWIMKANLGDRDHGWRTLLYPLPFDGRDLFTGRVEIDPIDPTPHASAACSLSPCLRSTTPH